MIYTQNDTIQGIKYVKRDIGSEVRNMAEYKMLMDCDDGEVLFVTRTGDEFVLEMREELSIGQIEDVVMDIVLWMYKNADRNLFIEMITEGLVTNWETFMMYAFTVMMDWSENEGEVAVAGNVEVKWGE